MAGAPPSSVLYCITAFVGNFRSRPPRHWSNFLVARAQLQHLQEPRLCGARLRSKSEVPHGTSGYLEHVYSMPTAAGLMCSSSQDCGTSWVHPDEKEGRMSLQARISFSPEMDLFHHVHHVLSSDQVVIRKHPRVEVPLKIAAEGSTISK